VWTKSTSSASIFNPLHLQDFAHRIARNLYWYRHGFSPRALIAWAVSTIIGMLFCNTHLFAGPLARLAGGADLSFISSAAAGALLYLALGRTSVGWAAPQPTTQADPSRHSKNL